MENLLVNKRTKRQLDAILSDPAHGYIFSGKSGREIEKVADFFIDRLFVNKKANINRWILKIKPEENKKIPISRTLEIKRFLNQKAPQDIPYKAVIISNADKLSIEAANSLLLTLEEPPEKSIIILTTTNLSCLPNTIRSRMQLLQIIPPTKRQIKNYYSNESDLNLLLDLFGPLPSEIDLAKRDRAYLENTIKAYKDARKFFNGDLFEKLFLAKQYSESGKVDLLIKQLARVIISQPSLNYKKSLLFADSCLYNNANPRLVLENLALDLL